MKSMLPTKPSNNAVLLKLSVKLYKAAFKHFIILSGVLSFLSFIPRFISLFMGQDIFHALAPLSPHRLWFVALNLLCLILFIAIIWSLYCTSRGRHEPFVEDLSKGLKKVIYVIVAAMIEVAIFFAVSMVVYGVFALIHTYHSFLSQNIWGLLLVAVILLGLLALLIYVSLLFLFFIPLIAIENKGIIVALERSVFLAWNHPWRIFSLQIAPWICYLIVLLIVRFLFNIEIHIYFFPTPAFNILTTVFQLILFALFIPWVGALMLVQLKDLELRRHLVTNLK